MATNSDGHFRPDPLHPYKGLTLEQVRKSQEMVAIKSAIIRKGTLRAAAEELGLTRRGLFGIMGRLGMTDPRPPKWKRRDVSLDAR